MKRIYWVSRHNPHSSQVEALSKLFFCNVSIFRHDKPFRDAEEIIERFKDGNFDDLVVVAPLSVLDRLCQLGVKPLWAKCEVCLPADSQWGTFGRLYKFIEFRRIEKLELQTSDAKPGGWR